MVLLPSRVRILGWMGPLGVAADSTGASGRPVRRVQGRGGSRASLATLSYATWIQRLVRVAAPAWGVARGGRAAANGLEPTSPEVTPGISGSLANEEHVCIFF